MSQLKDQKEDQLLKTMFGDLVADLQDDCAAIRWPADQLLLVSTDALCSGVHFFADAAPELIAQKAIRSNVSDIVASGGQPKWFSWSLSLPSHLPLTWLESFVKGAKQAMTETGVKLSGGDLTRAHHDIVISITVLGSVPPQDRLHRRGAQAGDGLWITGHLGEAGLGLEVIMGHVEVPDPDAWIARHFISPFRGSFASALAVSSLATAMMDLSDGLATDLPRLAKVNQLGFQIDLKDLPRSPKAKSVGLTCEQAFTFGEDYELLISVPSAHNQALVQLAKEHEVPIKKIGHLTTSSAFQVFKDEQPVNLPTAWQHFS